MCYPCNSCGRCGKFDPESPLYVPTPKIVCLKCQGEVDPQTGRCMQCGNQVLKVFEGKGDQLTSPRHR